MAKYISNKIKAAELVKNCWKVYNAKLDHKNPIVFNNISFNPNELGYCQRNVRKIVEATIWQKEWTLPYSACCANSSCQRLIHAGIQQTTWEKLNSGDLVYFSGGGVCKTCGQPVGHVGIIVSNNDINTRLMWQNTSRDSLGLCITPILDSQIKRITNVFRILPQ